MWGLGCSEFPMTDCSKNGILIGLASEMGTLSPSFPNFGWASQFERTSSVALLCTIACNGMHMAFAHNTLDLFHTLRCTFWGCRWSAALLKNWRVSLTLSKWGSSRPVPAFDAGWKVPKPYISSMSSTYLIANGEPELALQASSLIVHRSVKRQ